MPALHCTTCLAGGFQKIQKYPEVLAPISPVLVLPCQDSAEAGGGSRAELYRAYSPFTRSFQEDPKLHTKKNGHLLLLVESPTQKKSVRIISLSV